MPKRKKVGDRTRFQFALDESERDRVVARWLDAQPNASEIVRIILYGIATGQSAGVVAVQPAAVESRAPVGVDRSDPRVQVFMDIDD